MGFAVMRRHQRSGFLRPLAFVLLPPLLAEYSSGPLKRRHHVRERAARRMPRLLEGSHDTGNCSPARCAPAPWEDLNQ